MSRAPSRVCVLGLDGLDFDVIEPLLQSGQMPTLARLREGGAWGKLRSVVPPISSAAWTSMCSGQPPGEHGILGFTRTRVGAYTQEVIRTADIKSPLLWDYLGGIDKRSIVFNLPNLYPAVPLNGVMVTGLITPHENSDWCYPAEVGDELAAAGLGFAKQPSVHKLRRMTPAQATETLERFANRQAETAKRLLTSQPWDLAFLVFGSSDVVQHAFFGRAASEAKGGRLFDTPGGEVMRRHFITLDRIAGEIIDLLQDAAILVVSDHGFGHKPRLFYVNQWLANEGLLHRSRFPSLSASASRSPKRRVVDTLSKIGLGFLARALPARIRDMEIRIPALGRALFTRGLSWPNTRAFSDPATLGTGIRINLQGREPEGSVSPGEEYEALRDELLHALLALRDPLDGGPLATGVWSREEICPGEAAAHAPDIIIEYRDDAIRPVGDHTRSRDLPLFGRRGQVFADAPADEAAWHTNYGIVIAAGNGITGSGMMEGASILNIAPTVLTLLGLQPPASMTDPALSCLDPALAAGRGQTQGLSPAPAGTDPGSVPTLADEDERIVAERLKDLGYM